MSHNAINTIKNISGVTIQIRGEDLLNGNSLYVWASDYLISDPGLPQLITENHIEFYDVDAVIIVDMWDAYNHAVSEHIGLTGKQVGEVWAQAGTHPELGLLCDGTGYNPDYYSDLFDQIGYTYGGAGTVFNVPDLRDRGIVGNSAGKAEGTTGGADSVTLTVAQLPAHSHDVITTAQTGESKSPSGKYFARAAASAFIEDLNGDSLPMGAGTISSTGSDNSVSTQSPYISIPYYIYTG